MDLTSFSKPELENLIEDARKELKNRHAEDLKKAREEIKRMAAELGVSIEEVIGIASGGRAGSKAQAPARYANPNDPTQTWTGKGRQPQWFKAAISSGISPESLEL